MTNVSCKLTNVAVNEAAGYVPVATVVHDLAAPAGAMAGVAGACASRDPYGKQQSSVSAKRNPESGMGDS